MFREDRVDKFNSLQNIIFHGNATENTFHSIHNHFCMYSNFRRSKTVYSEQYGVNGAYVFIEHIGSIDLINAIWLKGIKSKNMYLATYENGKLEHCPFIISIIR